MENNSQNNGLDLEIEETSETRINSNKNTLDFKKHISKRRLSFDNVGKKRWQNVESYHCNEAFIPDNYDVENNSWINEDFEELMPSKRPSLESTNKSWDSFVTLPHDENDDTLSTEWINVFIIGFKILVYLLTFVFVLISAVFSKLLFLLVTSMTRNNQTVVLCTQHIDHLTSGKTFIARYTDSDPERMAWIWCLFFIMIFPIIVTFIRCINNCIFKKYENPKFITLLTVFIIETLDLIGLVLLALVILPEFESSRGAMLSSSICLIPSILAFISRNNDFINVNKKIMSFDLLAIVIQILSLISWTTIAYLDNIRYLWTIPFILVFISIGYWDNYFFIDESQNLNKVFQFFSEVKNDLNKSRYFTYLLISIWKIILVFSIFLIYYDLNESKYFVQNMFNQFREAFSKHKINMFRVSSRVQESDSFDSNPSNILWVMSLQIVLTIVCYNLSVFACKIWIQLFSFTFPLTIVGPITIVLIKALCHLRLSDRCKLTEAFVSLEYIFWNSKLDLMEEEWTFINCLESITWILSLCSQIWITLHIWKPNSERLAKTDNLFLKPSFCSVFIDQSLVLNRRLDPGMQSINEINSRKASKEQLELNELETIRIFLCATMWHENREEMIQLLKSVIRMDSDQSARRQARQWFHVDSKHTDYYEIESHLFFDDAFEDNGRENSERVINNFVKQLIEVMDLSASIVHECKIRLKRPVITSTPYGGRLVWTLPGHNKLFVHLKDKTLIRHRKRWSQVMYMYYLLAYRFKDMSFDLRQKVSENTFILALDGDINFRPKAVQLLVDLMKKHNNLGAACGRIHPIGSGPMVWYQKFEYAISHWLQKSCEHVFGCVLCSPGCFSLFRAKALMTENVMNKYTIKPTEALHYVQYDQGEDRWLCTLLLQQGWRIEYCAASDSYTHAPENYGEFYTQRRRWTPSTIFNILDLLKDFKRTVYVNDNISTLFILYEGALMVGTLLSPGTIFLMIVGAMGTSFDLNNNLCLLYSGSPILVFIIICYSTKNETQIKISLILSTAYALLMLTVLVSTLIEIIKDGIWQPSALFFITLCLSFLFAAVIHPTEFLCVLPFIFYLLCIPCMYLLLTIYSIINLNVVTWGTREVAIHSTPETNKNKQKQNKKEFFKYFNIKDLFEKSGFNCINCICCSATNEEQTILKEILEIKSQLNSFETTLETSLKANRNSNSSTLLSSLSQHSDTISNQNKTKINKYFIENEYSSDKNSEINDDIFETDKPFWTQQQCFEPFSEQELDPQELQFWREFIDSYLLPLDKDSNHEKKVEFDLKGLRNKLAFAFGISNALFILLVIILQRHEDIFSIYFQFGREVKTIKTYNENEMIYEYEIQKSEKIKMDVIGLILVIFFGIILGIQFIGMLFHRLHTFSLLMAVTQLNICKREQEVSNIQEVINENAVEIAKRLQKLNSLDTNRNSDKSLLSNSSNNRPEFTELEEAFMKRCLSLKDNYRHEEVLPESDLTRNRNHTINRSEVIRRLYLEFSRETIKRKKRLVSEQNL